MNYGKLNRNQDCKSINEHYKCWFIEGRKFRLLLDCSKLIMFLSQNLFIKRFPFFLLYLSELIELWSDGGLWEDEEEGEGVWIFFDFKTKRKPEERLFDSRVPSLISRLISSSLISSKGTSKSVATTRLKFSMISVQLMRRYSMLVVYFFALG